MGWTEEYEFKIQQFFGAAKKEKPNLFLDLKIKMAEQWRIKRAGIRGEQSLKPALKKFQLMRKKNDSILMESPRSS